MKHRRPMGFLPPVPQEIFQQIISLLDKADVLALRATCKTFEVVSFDTFKQLLSGRLLVHFDRPPNVFDQLSIAFENRNNSRRPNWAYQEFFNLEKTLTQSVLRTTVTHLVLHGDCSLNGFRLQRLNLPSLTSLEVSDGCYRDMEGVRALVQARRDTLLKLVIVDVTIEPLEMLPFYSFPRTGGWYNFFKDFLGTSTLDHLYLHGLQYVFADSITSGRNKWVVRAPCQRFGCKSYDSHPDVRNGGYEMGREYLQACGRDAVARAINVWLDEAEGVKLGKCHRKKKDWRLSQRLGCC